MIKTCLKTILTDIFAVLLGGLLTLAFAPYEIFPLAIIAPAALLALWQHTSPSRAFWLGFLFGLGFFGTGVYWVYISVHDMGGVPILLSGMITAAFIAILSIFPATVGSILTRYSPRTHTAKLVCAFPAIWVGSEWVRSWIFTGFPWLFLGYSQTHSPLGGFASLLGVYGVSLVTLFSSGLVLNTIIKFRQKIYSAAYLNLFLFILIWLVGSSIYLIPWTAPRGNPVSVALVQGNIPQTIKWSPTALQLSFKRYETLTEPLWGKDKFIIWPEAALPLPLQNATDFIEKMDEKARATGSQLILGIPIQTPDATGYYNAIVTLGADKKVYLKRRLVPFGEYTPLSQFFSKTLSFMDIPMSNMVPGHPLQGLLVVNHINILPAICYEIAFPDLIRMNDQSIGFILTLTNDAWFGASNAQAQHLQMAAMRAMEFRRSVLFVGNDGITAIIDPDGRIKSAAPPHQPAVLTGSIQPMIGLTPWMRNGTDPVLFILIFLLMIAYSKNQQRLSTEIAIKNKKQDILMNKHGIE